MTILDVSKYQSAINYQEVAKHVDGVILRCGYTGWGTANECVADSLFEKHYEGFKAAGVPVGAYYYSAADNSAKVREEVEFCKKMLAGKSFELPIYIDIENPQRMEKLSVDQLTGQVIQWCDAMEDAGYFVGVYANTDYFTRKLDAERLAKLYTLWLADYRTNYNKTLPRDMHQYTSTGRVLGISGNVDLNTLHREGLMEDIKRAGLNGMLTTEVPDPILYDVDFGPCTAGDRDAVVAVATSLGLNPVSRNTGTAANGAQLYTVGFVPMTAGDLATIEQLGERLGVSVVFK